MDSNELKRKLKNKGPIEFVNSLLFDAHAWCFPSQSGDDYTSIREQFGQVFDIAPTDVAIVGSGKYGFSLAPDKDFRQFQPDERKPDPSDIDLVVVSKPLFNKTWHHLRIAHYNGAIDARKAFQEDIFRRFIMVGTDETRDTKYLRDLRSLLNRVQKLSTTRLGITQTIKCRIYYSWSDAKAYHIWSLQKLGEKHGIQ